MRAAPTFLFAAFLSTAVTSCSGLQNAGGEIKSVVIDCGTQAIQSSVGQLWPVIQAVLTGDAPDWRKMLLGLASEFGRDAVACALEHTSVIIGENAPAHAPAPARAQAARAKERAKTFEAEQGWTFAPATK